MTEVGGAQAGAHIIVIGGGLAGVCTAYELARAGFSVTVIEANKNVALETSYANGGMLTPSQSDPWNSPGVGRQLFRSLVGRSSAMKLRPRSIPSHLLWGAKFIKNATPDKYRIATAAGFRLASDSVKKITEAAKRHQIEYDGTANGSMKIFNCAADLEEAVKHLRCLNESALKFQVITPFEVTDIEPQLHGLEKHFVGAIYYPDDKVGDARKFTEAMAAKAEALGVKFLYDVSVEKLLLNNSIIVGVETDNGPIAGSDVVLANGIAAPALAKKVGVGLSIKPVKGYSLTFDVRGVNNLPSMPIVDEHVHTALTVLGNRIRILGTAEFAGTDKTIDHARIAYLRQFLQRVQPELARQVEAATGESWAGLRPVSADGLPYIGQSNIKGLWVNAGHGHLGWTMSMGSASLLACLMAGKAPEIDPAPYRVGR